MVATAATLLGLGAAQAVPTLAGFAFLAGLAIDLYRPAVSALVADLVSPADRPRAFALLYWAINLGVSIAAVLGGALAERGYWLLFVFDAATCLVFAALIARGVPETRPARVPGDRGGYSATLRDPLLLGLAGVVVAGSVVYMQCFVTLPLVITADGLGPSAYGVIYAVNPLAVIIVQPLTLRWLTRLSLVRVYAGSVLLTGLGFGLTAFAHSIPAYAATVLVWTLGEIAFNAVGPTLVADIAPAHLRGRYAGVIGLAFGASALIAPLAGTAVLEHLGDWALWAGCFALGVLAAAAVFALGPAINHRRAAAPAAEARAPEP
jgi:MFS family permease